MNRYYLTQRPPMPGAFPKPADNRVLSVESFDEKTYCMQIGQLAWGYIEYEHPLSEQQVSSYELVKGGQTMNRYMTMRERQQQKVNALPLGFAFGNRQFEEMMRGWGLDPEKDLDKIYRLGNTGGFYKKSDAQLIRDTFRRNREEMEAAIEEDKTGEGFIYEMFLYELDNHEYSYTRDTEDTLNALGYTAEEVLGDPQLKRGLEKAVAEIWERE